MVTEHQVRERAYHIWDSEGRIAGRDEAYWLRAEAELRIAATPLVVEAVAGGAAPRKASAPAVSRAKAPKAEKAVASKTAAKAAARTKRAAEGVALH